MYSKGNVIWFLLIALLLSTSTIWAQSVQNREARGLEIKARNYMANKEYDLARPILDGIATDTAHVNSCEYWYLRGFLYKALYKSDETNNGASDFLSKAFDYYEKSMTLDADGSHKDGNIKGIKTIAVLSNNAAVTSLYKENCTENDCKNALANFDLYIKAMRVYETPEAELTKNRVEFKLALGAIYNQIYDAHTKKHSEHNVSIWDNITSTYKGVLVLDSKNSSANYCLGSAYYNRAVHIIMHEMGYDVDMITLSDIQDKCINLFKEALPYLNKAHVQDAINPPAIEGLAGIYFSLNEIDKSNYYKELFGKLNDNTTEEPLKIVEDHRTQQDWYNWEN